MTDRPPKPPLWRRLLTLRNVGVALFLWLIGSFLWIFVWPRGPIPISRGTTYLTEPVGPDGYIDYYAALQPKELIPAEDNAAGWYIRAGGINLYQDHPAELVPALAAELGISPTRDVGEQLVDMHSFVESSWRSEAGRSSDTEGNEDVSSQILRLLGRCEAAPWTASEFPRVAKWLEANKEPLELILEGVGRERFHYFPKSSGHNWQYQYAFLTPFRDFAELLAISANLAIGEGDLAAAEKSVDAIYQLANHHNEPQGAIGLAVCFALDSDAFSLEKALIAAETDRQQVNRRRALNRDRHASVDIIESVDCFERFAALSLIQTIDREARGAVPPGSAWSPGFSADPWIRRYQLSTIDTAECSRRVNVYYDMLVEAMRSPPHLQDEAMHRVEQWKQTLTHVDSRSSIPFYASALLNDQVVRLNLQDGEGLINSALRFEMRHVLLDVAYAARLFELDTGLPAKQQSDLVPKYLDRWPTDSFHDTPLEHAVVDGRWIVFFRSPYVTDSTVDEIAEKYHWCRIDIPDALAAAEPGP